MAKKSIQLDDALYNYLLSVSSREPLILQEIRYSITDEAFTKFMSLPEQSQFMQFVVHLLSVKRVLEIGTFIGYMATAIALALPVDGELVCCEKNAEWARIAKTWLQKAEVLSKVKFKIGDAEQSLTQLIEEGQAHSFDLIFIDANKTGYNVYYEQSLQLIKPNGLIIIDNTLWGGQVLDNQDQTTATRVIRELNQKIHADPRVNLTLLPLGDGMTLVKKIANVL